VTEVRSRRASSRSTSGRIQPCSGRLFVRLDDANCLMMVLGPHLLMCCQDRQSKWGHRVAHLLATSRCRARRQPAQASATSPRGFVDEITTYPLRHAHPLRRLNNDTATMEPVNQSWGPANSRKAPRWITGSLNPRQVLARFAPRLIVRRLMHSGALDAQREGLPSPRLRHSPLWRLRGSRPCQ
jgi:hypothetical protein